MEDYGLVGETEEVLLEFVFVGWGCVAGGLLFDSGPGQIDVEEEEEDAKAHYGGLRSMFSMYILRVDRASERYIKAILLAH